MRVTFIGDVIVSMEQLPSYYRNGNYDFDAAFVSLRKEFNGSDLLVANLETPIAGKRMRYTYEQYSFNSPVQLPIAMKRAGVNIVTTANNHCLDRGEEGLVETIFQLQSCGLECIGTHAKKQKSYMIKEIDGIKIGFISFTYGTNAFINMNYLKKENRYMVDLLQHQELSNPAVRMLYQSRCFPVRCMRVIAKKACLFQFNKPVYERRECAKREMDHFKNTILDCKKQGADYIVVYLHIGGQYNSHPTDYTIKICELSRKYGANAVIANHEHVIHEINWRNISNKSFCIYSLGNFLSSAGVLSEPYNKLAQYSVAVNIDLNRNIKGSIQAQYSFEIFCNHMDDMGRIISEPLVEYISNCCDNMLKEKLLYEYQILMNRICCTKKKFYPIQKIYKIEC